MGLDQSRERELGRIDVDKKELQEKEIVELKSRLERLKNEKMRAEQKLNRNVFDKIVDNRYLIIGIGILIILFGISLRVDMLPLQGFFEPDGFFHYSVILQSIANNFIVPHFSIYSGFAPNHNAITEPAGLYYVTLIPYFFLRYLGISAYTIERVIPVFFGVLDMLGAFLVVRYLSKSNVLGLLSMFMVAISSGDTARTTALVYRGDGFITIFLILAIFFIFKGIESIDMEKKYAYFGLAGLILGIGTGVWNGAPFTIIVYILGVLLLIIYSFINANIKLMRDSILLSLSLLITILVQHIFMAIDIIRGGQALSSAHILLFYLPILIGSVIGWVILSNKGPMSIRKKLGSINASMGSRILFLIGFGVIVLLIMLIPFYSYLVSIATGQGLVVAGTPLTVTIEELQKPNFQFLWVSFSFELFMAPIGVLLFILFRFIKIKALEGTQSAIASPAFIMLLAYLLATAYLQANAIRFNSLVAVPIAIFSAYMVYVIGKIAYYYTIKVPTEYTSSTILKALVFGGSIIALLIVVGYTGYMGYVQSGTLFQADGINPYFLNATLWLKNNTAMNATVLAVWPDGSVIEGLGNRQSLMDSVAGQNSANIANFSDFLFNDTSDTQYLNSIGRPDYLFVRNYWFQELGGIAIEGSIKNTSQFGMFNMVPYNPVRTTNAIIFPFSQYPYNAILVSQNSSTLGQENFSAYINYENTGYVPLRSVLLYNTNTGVAHSIITNSIGANYTLFVTYGQNGSAVNIQSGALITPKLEESNAFKFLVLCGATQCPYDTANVTLTLVHANPDTKIFKINYNT